MKTLQRGFSGVLFGGLLAFAGHAADSTPTQAQLDARARLAKICDACGIVESVTIQTTKGEGGLAGKIGGAVLGGVLGHQIGGGTGKTLATIGGAVAGGYAGNEVEKNVNKKTVWRTRVTLKNGTERTYENSADPGLRKGDVVEIENGQLRRQ